MDCGPSRMAALSPCLVVVVVLNVQEPRRLGRAGHGRGREGPRRAAPRAADTADVSAIESRRSRADRRWSDPELVRVLRNRLVNARAKLHASLALLPVDPTQVAYLRGGCRMPVPARCRAEASPEIPSRRPDPESLAELGIGPSRRRASPPDRQRPGPATIPTHALGRPRRQGGPGPRHGRAPISSSSWLELLRPVQGRAHDSSRRDLPRRGSPRDAIANWPTTCLVEYASDDPDLLADLLMDAEPKAYASLFPVVEKQAEKVCPVFRARTEQAADAGWIRHSTPPGRKPDAALDRAIESAQGLLARPVRLLPDDAPGRVPGVAEGLRKSGYRPVRFRPYADGKVGEGRGGLDARRAEVADRAGPFARGDSPPG